MSVLRLITVVAWCAIGVAALAVSAHAQSAGDEPSLDQRLRYLLKMPEQTIDAAPPTEVERSQEEARRAREQNRRSPGEAGRSPSGPGYIGPLSTDTRTGRMGAAGWTTEPEDSLGRATKPEYRSGAPGFGYAVEWGVPRRAGTEAP